MKPQLLVVTPGGQWFREYLLSSISQDYRMHLFCDREPAWEREYLHGWTVLNTLDVDAMTAAARAVSAENRIDGVICWDETRILGASRVAEALGLPGGDPEVVARCRDKHRTRLALAARNVPQPRSLPVADVDAALAAGRSTGYPAVLKPRALGGSIGVTVVRSPAEVAAGFAIADTGHAALPEVPADDWGILWEEYADGPEISVDAAVFRGEVWPICVGHKQLGFAPHCEEVGHLVDGADPLLTDPELLAVLRETHAALGFTDGMTHTELRLTAAGPRVIEVNARVGGDLIPYLGLLVGGTDPGLAAAAIACGRQPRTVPPAARVAAIRFFYPERDDTVVGSVRVDGGLPPAVDRFVVLAEPGASLSPPPKGTMVGRVAYATVVADNRRECLAALDAVQERLRILPPDAA
ncbi:ATP-grasp domain-containing protein [Micromonospora sp. NBC_01412]|uniref:ATP-grasp domain-containing protein n=1 Tax=Micromonospora sp. NBC_01412 TaxID=2903590 RepID=UPI00324663C4